ncbi:MAG: hypothetical protein M3Y27_02420, partial [Acidobacteriota bacterium]|nr:hypothetical protein [Acidobacteriota bacterium]
LRKRLAEKNTPEFSLPNSKAGFLLVLAVLSSQLMFSLVPPIVIFHFQHLSWSEHMCIDGLMFSIFAAIVLFVLSKISSRIRNLIGKLQLLVSRLTLINSSGIAGQMYHESERH